MVYCNAFLKKSCVNFSLLWTTLQDSCHTVTFNVNGYWMTWRKRGEEEGEGAGAGIFFRSFIRPALNVYGDYFIDYRNVLTEGKSFQSLPQPPTPTPTIHWQNLTSLRMSMYFVRSQQIYLLFSIDELKFINNSWNWGEGGGGEVTNLLENWKEILELCQILTNFETEVT